MQAEILNLLVELRRRRGLTYLFVSHNLAVVAHICGELAVMQAAGSSRCRPQHSGPVRSASPIPGNCSGMGSEGYDRAAAAALVD